MDNKLDQYYNDYTYQPATPTAGQVASDWLLGTNFQQTANQNKLNWEMLKEQNKFNEYMSSTAYQRAVQDMKKAGINPMLAALNGGSSTPTSSSANQQAAEPQSNAIHRKSKEIGKLLLTALMFVL